MSQFIEIVDNLVVRLSTNFQRKCAWVAISAVSFIVAFASLTIAPGQAFAGAAMSVSSPATEQVSPDQDLLQLVQFGGYGGRYGGRPTGGRRPGGRRPGGRGGGYGGGIGIGSLIIQESIRANERAREREWRRRRRFRDRYRDRDRDRYKPQASVVCRQGRVRRGRCFCGSRRTRVRLRRNVFVCKRTGRPETDVVIEQTGPRRCSRRGWTRQRCTCPGTLRRRYVKGRGYQCTRPQVEDGSDVVTETGPRRCSRRGWTRRRCTCPGSLRRRYVKGRGYRCTRPQTEEESEVVTETPPGRCSRRGWTRQRCTCPGTLRRRYVEGRGYQCARPQVEEESEVVTETPPRRCGRRGWTSRRCTCPGSLRRRYAKGRGYKCFGKQPQDIVEEISEPPRGTKKPTRITTKKPRLPKKPARVTGVTRLPVIPPIGARDRVPNYVPGEVVVALRRNAPRSLARRLARRHGLRVLETVESDLINRRIVRFGMRRSRNVPAMVKRLKRNRDVLGAQPNHLFRKPNDQSSAPGPVMRDEIRNNQLRRKNLANRPPPVAPNQPGAPGQPGGNAPPGVTPPVAGGNLPANGPIAGNLPANPPTVRPGTNGSQWQAKPSDLQYALVKVGVREAATITGAGNGKGIVVAVIDSGIDGRHADLKGAVRKSYNALGDKKAKPDDHGTAVAGIIGGRGLVRGVAPGAGILDVRAFKAGARDGPLLATTFVLQRGMAWAMKNKARVLNLSFTGPHDELLEEAIQSISRKRAIMVAAAGNGGAKAKPAYPAAYKEVIAVTATDPADKLYDKANRGAYIALAAPGVEILAPITGNAHNMHSGTSFAAAHISGILALMLERAPNLSAAEALEILTSGARDLGPPGRDELFGAGEANAYRALQKLQLTAARKP